MIGERLSGPRPRGIGDRLFVVRASRAGKAQQHNSTLWIRRRDTMSSPFGHRSGSTGENDEQRRSVTAKQENHHDAETTTQDLVSTSTAGGTRAATALLPALVSRFVSAGLRSRSRDSKAVLDPDSHPETPPIIELTVPDWERLCRRIVDRRPVLAAGSVSVRLSANGTARFRCSRSGVELSFSADEMAAFVAGVLTGEFRQRQLAA